MTRKAERIRKELSPKFPEWTRNFRGFLELYYSDIYVPETDECERWESMKKIYASVLEAMICMSGVRDQWEGPEFLPLAVDAGLEVFYRADKLECPFFFGTDELGFFLSADLIYSKMIRKMDDRFWFQMAELTRFGEIDLWEHRAWPESRARQEPWFHRKSRSRIFHLIRSAVAWEKENGYVDELGMMIIRWKYDTPW